jgi:hypothetical protein
MSYTNSIHQISTIPGNGSADVDKSVINRLATYAKHCPAIYVPHAGYYCKLDAASNESAVGKSVNYRASLRTTDQLHSIKKNNKLRDQSPRANYTDRATAACRQS